MPKAKNIKPGQLTNMVSLRMLVLVGSHLSLSKSIPKKCELIPIKNWKNSIRFLKGKPTSVFQYFPMLLQ